MTRKNISTAFLFFKTSTSASLYALILHPFAGTLKFEVPKRKYNTGIFIRGKNKEKSSVSGVATRSAISRKYVIKN